MPTTGLALTSDDAPQTTPHPGKLNAGDPTAKLALTSFCPIPGLPIAGELATMATLVRMRVQAVKRTSERRNYVAAVPTSSAAISARRSCLRVSNRAAASR